MSETHEDREALAAEYVLGVQDAATRGALAMRLPQDAELRAMTEEWERRLAPLNEDVPPVEPPAHVWSRIAAMLSAGDGFAQAKVIDRHGLWHRAGTWRLAAAAAAMAALLLLAFNLGLIGPSATPRYVALLADNQAKPSWHVEAAGREVRVAPLAPDVLAQAGRDRAFELWLVPAGGQAPISLGLLDPQRGVRLSLDEALARQLPQAAAFAVSLEPPGGSPTGSATGPILHVGSIVRRAEG